MIKKLLIVVVILGLAWTIPATRKHMARIVEPVVVRLGPVGAWAANPIRRYNTRNEIVLLVRELSQDHKSLVPPPTPRNFPAWVRRNTNSGREGKDAWGNDYYLRQIRTGLTVGSPGEDGEIGTEDDLTRTLTF